MLVQVLDLDAVPLLDVPLIRDLRTPARVARAGGPARRVAALRQALTEQVCAVLDVAAPELAVVADPCPICAGGHGKPRLRGAELEFSVARSGRWGAIAIAGVPVGVDVEQRRDLAADLPALLEMLHPDEAAEIKADADPAAAFFDVWTRKEAYLKAIGVGLSRDPAADYCGTRAGSAPPSGWRFESVAGPDSVACAVVTAAVPGTVGPDSVPAR